MLALVRRGPANLEKPTEPVRGQVSRLPWVWWGLCFAVPFNDPTRDSARDLVANAAPSSVTNLAWTKDNRGNAAAALDNTASINYPDNPAHNRPSTEITAYARLRLSGTPDTAGGVFGKKMQMTDPYLSWAIYHQVVAANGIAGHLSVDNTYVYWEGGAGLSNTEWSSVFLRWRSGTAPTVDILNERGTTLSTFSHGSTISGTITYVAGQPIRINAKEIDDSNSACDYSQALLWSRRLTDTELQALVADPFGWYAPKRETVGLSGVTIAGYREPEWTFGQVVQVG